MDPRKILKNQFKQIAAKSGIFIIQNSANDKIFVGSAQNLAARINRFQFELAHGLHKNLELQNDYTAYGKDSFEFKIVDHIKNTEDSADTLELLAELEAEWLNKLKPFEEKGYNAKSARK